MAASRNESAKEWPVKSEAAWYEGPGQHGVEVVLAGLEVALAP